MRSHFDDSYDFLVARMGESLAYHWLTEIEKAARIRPQHHISDLQARLSHACRMQDAQQSEHGLALAEASR